jgi:hypothetical protein
VPGGNWSGLGLGRHARAGRRAGNGLGRFWLTGDWLTGGRQHGTVIPVPLPVLTTGQIAAGHMADGRVIKIGGRDRAGLVVTAR